jgi:hypothetical protein
MADIHEMKYRHWMPSMANGLQAVSLSLSTEVGNIVGLGLVFDSVDTAEQAVGHFRVLYDSPGISSEGLSVSFEEKADMCRLVITLASVSETVTFNIENVNLSLLDDLRDSLKGQRHYFLIFCIKDAEGDVVPYRTDINHVIKSDMIVNGRVISGAPSGLWPTISNPFTSL